MECMYATTKKMLVACVCMYMTTCTLSIRRHVMHRFNFSCAKIAEIFRREKQDSLAQWINERHFFFSFSAEFPRTATSCMSVFLYLRGVRHFPTDVYIYIYLPPEVYIHQKTGKACITFRHDTDHCQQYIRTRSPLSIYRYEETKTEKLEEPLVGQQRIGLQDDCLTMSCV